MGGVIISRVLGMRFIIIILMEMDIWLGMDSVGFWGLWQGLFIRSRKIDRCGVKYGMELRIRECP